MSPQPETPSFSTPAEEMGHFRKRIEEKEEATRGRGFSPESERIVRDEAISYGQEVPKEVLPKKYKLKEEKSAGELLGLSREEHDKKIKELLDVLELKGLKNTLTILEKMNNPHLEDDFHRALVQYVKYGPRGVARLVAGKEWRALHMTLYEVSLPGTKDKNEAEKPLKELLSSMEQFYAGMQRLGEEKKSTLGHYTLELALPGVGEELIFYSAVPDSHKELFEKQVLAIFPKADLIEQKNDYNVFSEDGFTTGGDVSLSRNAIFPLKTYEQFDYDPLHIILNAFSNIKEKGEGAAIQIVVRPMGNTFVKKYEAALVSIRKGASVEEVTNIPHSVWQILKKEFGVFTLGKKMYEEEKPKDANVPRTPPPIDQMVVENIERKIGSPVVAVNIRIVVSAQTKERAEELFSHLESSLNQFENTRGNKFILKELTGRGLKKLLRAFSFRDYVEGSILPLSLRELTSIIHFPQGEVLTPRFKEAHASTLPIPAEASKEGTLLGINKHRNEESKVYLGKEDRLRHFYCVGQTGTGKTTLLKNMIVSDMKNTCDIRHDIFKRLFPSCLSRYFFPKLNDNRILSTRKF